MHSEQLQIITHDTVDICCFHIKKEQLRVFQANTCKQENGIDPGSDQPHLKTKGMVLWERVDVKKAQRMYNYQKDRCNTFSSH